MVLPCMHCVACKQCSDRLAQDPLQVKKCIYCRVEITHVLD